MGSWTSKVRVDACEVARVLGSGTRKEPPSAETRGEPVSSVFGEGAVGETAHEVDAVGGWHVFLGPVGGLGDVLVGLAVGGLCGGEKAEVFGGDHFYGGADGDFCAGDDDREIERDIGGVRGAWCLADQPHGQSGAGGWVRERRFFSVEETGSRLGAVRRRRRERLPKE